MILRNLNHIKLKNLLAAFFIMLISLESAHSSEDSLGITNLMTAAIDGDVDGVKFFSKADSTKINQTNIAGSTALNLASRKDNYEIISILIKSGADVNIADNEGWTPLMRAARAGNDKIVQELLTNKADPYAINNLGESSLINAANSKCFKCFLRIFDAIRSNKEFTREELERSFIIAKNHEDAELQNFISTNISETQKSYPQAEEKIFTLDRLPEIFVEENKEEDQRIKTPTKSKGEKIFIFKESPELPSKENIEKPSIKTKAKNFIYKSGQEDAALKNPKSIEGKSGDDEVIFKFSNKSEAKEAPKKRKVSLASVKPVQNTVKSQPVKLDKKVVKEEVKKTEKPKPVQPTQAPKLETPPLSKLPAIDNTSEGEVDEIEELRKSEIKSTTLIKPKPAPQEKAQPKFVIGVIE